MQNILKAVEKLTNSIEAMVRIPVLEEQKRHPLRCRCGRLFRKIETWVPHWREDHARLAKAYDKKSHHDRISLILEMMRAVKSNNPKPFKVQGLK